MQRLKSGLMSPALRLLPACMTFFFLGRIYGLGIGTIVAAFTMGKGIAIIGNWMDKKIAFVSVLQPERES